MIRLYQYAPVWGLSSGSPFCLKLETYLRMAGLAYEVRVALPFRAPKGKLPFIEDGGRTIADSGFIIDHLKAAYGDPLDGGLSAEERAGAHLVRRTIEESLYFAVLYGRWIDPAGWAVLRPAFFGDLPPVLRALVPPVARRTVRKSLIGQGIGRHAATEVWNLATADLDALSQALGDRRYFTGDEAAAVDAAAYGLFAQILFAPIENPIKGRLRALANLARYTERMRARWWAG